MSSASNSTTTHGPHRARRYCCGARRDGANWSGLNVAAMVAGFVLFWPIGLFFLVWSISGRDVRELPEAIGRQWSRLTGTWTGAWGGRNGYEARGPSDNTVFEEFQQAQHERIREIRDEIKDRARRFRAFRTEAKRRADEEEFNRFMSGGPVRGDG